MTINDKPIPHVMYGNILGWYIENGLALSSSINSVGAGVSTLFQSNKKVRILNMISQ